MTLASEEFVDYSTNEKYEDFVESYISNNVIDRPLEVRFLWAVAGLNAEAGEVAGEIEKATRKGISPNPDNIKSELGDVLWFLTAMTLFAGFTLDELMEYNIDKLTTRRSKAKDEVPQ